MNFEEYLLSDICKLNNESYSKKDNWSFFNYLDTKNITKGKIDEIKYLDPLEDTIPSRAKRKVDNKDIIYSTVRPNQEHYGLIEEQPSNFLVSTGFTTIKVNTDIAIPEFIYYFITQKYITESLQTIAEQSTTSYPSIKSSDIGDLIISLPSLEIQNKITSILKNIDDKIKFNEKINQNLESLIKFVFDYWFLQFDFPNHENKPFKSSNGVMVKNDVLNIDIPNCFSCGKLEDFVDFVRGVEPGSKNYSEIQEEGFIPFIRVGDLGNHNNGVFVDTDLVNDKVLNPDDIILTLDGTVGIVKIGLNGAYSTGLRKLVIKDDRMNKPFLYCLIKSQYIQEIIKRYATGSNILHASGSIKHMDFILPNKEVMDKFNEFGSPILDQIVSNIEENKELISLRDFLLPLLMSGQVVIKD